MVPAFVAPSFMGPPSSPAETTTAPGPCAFPYTTLFRSSMAPPKPVKLPRITVYVPLVGAVAATSDAPVPVALLPRSTPVGDTSRIQGAKCARSEERRVGKREMWWQRATVKSQEDM